MVTYQIELFYNPEKTGYKLLQNVYSMFGLESPSAEELRTPFHTDEKTGKKTSSTRFSTPRRDRVLKLTDIVIDLPDMRIEISSSG